MFLSVIQEFIYLNASHVCGLSHQKYEQANLEISRRKISEKISE